MEGIIFFVVVMVFIVAFILVMKAKQKGKVDQAKKDFLIAANRMSEEAIPEVKGYETLAVQLAKKTDMQEELKKTGKYVAKKALVRVVSGNTLNYRETTSIVNSNDIYVVRYKDEKMYFFNVGLKLSPERMELKGDEVLCFSPDNIAFMKVKMAGFTICVQSGESFDFDFSKGVQERRLEFSKEYKEFRNYLKILSATI